VRGRSARIIFAGQSSFNLNTQPVKCWCHKPTAFNPQYKPTAFNPQYKPTAFNSCTSLTVGVLFLTNCVAEYAHNIPNTKHHTQHLTPHTSHLTPHTPHPTPHTSHLTPHTSHCTPHTSHLTPHTHQLWSNSIALFYCNSSNSAKTYGLRKTATRCIRFNWKAEGRLRQHTW
jgi:hypothetical protein